MGKLKVERAPFLNQLWHTALHLTDRGLTTQPIPCESRTFQVDFDFIDHNLVIATSDDTRKIVPLYPCSVANFYDETMACLAALDIEIANNTMPKELPTAIPFEQDTVHACYDTGAVDRWWRILAASAQVTAKHRSWFVGKASPVHFFWGSFDLTATRHNGEPTPIAPPTTPRPP